MNFVADESLDFPIVIALRKAGHDVFSIQEKHASIDDEIVFNLAKEKDRVLLTSDKDFGELVFRLKLVPSGIILLRLSELNNVEKIPIILGLIEKFEAKLHSSFSVVTPRKIRIVAI